MTNEVQTLLDPGAVADLARDPAADTLLRAHHMLSVVADHELTIVALHGDVALLATPGIGIGDKLMRAAPELEAHQGELEGLLGNRLRELEIGLIQREAAPMGRYVWAHAVAIQDAQEHVAGINYLLADATTFGSNWERNERNRRESSELRHRVAQLTMEAALAQSELQRLDDAKTQFVSAAAHEMRNPLASLIGFVELLETDNLENLGEAQRFYLAGVSRSAQRLRLLTNNMLDMTRLDANRLELVMVMVDPLELMELAVGDMQPLFDAKQQSVYLKAEPKLPLIWCDKLRAMQILANLLSNAHKYTPEGGSITVQVSRQKQKPMVCIRVKDTGIGIPIDDQYRLFDRFYRAGNAGAADGAGAGLGLAITQSLVRLHGGKIWFESKLGKGTSFFVTFPVAE